MTENSGGKSAAGKSLVDQNLIRQLATLLHETELSEIEIEHSGFRVRVVRQMVGVTTLASAAPAPAQASAPPAPAAETDVAKHPGVVTSPMVGTAYTAPEPTAEPFVKVGDSVREGQTVLIIEAMKTMNHIPAPRAGRVTRVLVQNAQPVEFGEPLLVIE